MNIQSAKDKITQRFSDVSEITDGIIRGVRRRGQQDIAAYVFDLSNKLPATVGGLSNYLDDVIGRAYFDESAAPDLRWNNYLYFIVRREEFGDPALVTAKRNIEEDRSYARKYVVFEDEFEKVLNEIDSVAVVEESTSSTDVVQVWAEKLNAIGLDDVLDGNRPIADVVRSIASGAAKQSIRARKSSGIEESQKLISAHLESIDLRGFRANPGKKQFDGLGKANLLFGSNGVGKTSFLESIEFLFCGATRRSGSAERCAVSGLLTSKAEVKTSGLQPVSDFKTRQRIWYGSDDTSRQNNLPNQFARFNFLNTDAAAELSLLKEDQKAGPRSNTDSLSELLSGHEATLMWRRVMSVCKAVSDETKAKRSERAVAELDQKSKNQEIKNIEVTPGQADAVFAVFLKDLQRIGWKVAPTDKNSVSVQLIDTLSEVASKLGGARHLDWLKGVVTETTVADQVGALLHASKAVREISVKIQVNEKRLNSLMQQEAAANGRIASLSAIAPEVVEDLLHISHELKAVNEELAKNTKSSSLIPTVRAPEGWQEAWGMKPITEARNESIEKLTCVRGEVSESKRKLAELIATQSNLQEAIAQLRIWANNVIKHKHSDSNCPVCGTEFMGGELLRRMEALSTAPSELESSEVRRKIDQKSVQEERLEKETEWLEQLYKFSNTMSKSLTIKSVSEAMHAAEKLVLRQEELQSYRKDLNERNVGYSRTGLSLDHVRELCGPLGGEVKNEGDILDVGEAKRRLESFLQNVRNEMTLVKDEIEHEGAKVKGLLIQQGIDEDQPLSLALEIMLSRLSQAQRVIKTCDDIRQYFDIELTADLRAVHGYVESAVLGAKSTLSAVEREESSATRLKTLKEQLSKLEVRLTNLRGALERLAGAQKVLDDLIKNHSLEKATEAVVAATHKVADSIFRRIHSPAEYQITANAKVPLSRRDNNAGVCLNEVSTGQRAAYALSMFLAMNAQVKEGPKVILLDDPISHIDDLNALSFLDYLRNLVLESDRQLFFATADDKIAGLFQHKFGFLGKDFRTFELHRG